MLEFALEQLEQRECVGSAAGKTGQYPAISQAANLARVALDDGVAQRYLTIAADGGGAAPAAKSMGPPQQQA